VAETEILNLADDEFNRDGFILRGWRIEKTNHNNYYYDYSSTIDRSFSEDVVLYAVWDIIGGDKIEDDNLKYIYDYQLDGWEVSSCKSNDTRKKIKLVIPETVDGLPVVSIKTDALQWVSSVTIPKTVKQIEYCAIPQNQGSVTVSISPENDYYCSDNGMILTKDKKELIFVWSALQGKLVLPDCIETIRKGSFCGANLSSVVIGENVKKIEVGAFQETFSQMSIFVNNQNKNYYSDGVMVIDRNTNEIVGVDMGYEGTLEIPNGATNITKDVFHNCKASKYIIPASVSRIEYSAFENNEATAFVVSEENSNYKSIDGILFSKDGATLIRYPEKKVGASYYIPDFVKYIEEEAFRSVCDNGKLKDVYIPLTVIGCRNGAFQGFIKNYTIHFQSNEVPTGFDTNWTIDWTGKHPAKLVFNEVW